MIKKCIQCNKKFEKKINCSLKNWGTTKFCSRSCHDLFRKGKQSPSPKTTFKKGNKLSLGRKGLIGKENPLWKGGQVTITCTVCNKEFKVDQYRKNTAKNCSKECSKIYRKSTEFRLNQSDVIRKVVEQKLGTIRSYVTELDKLIRKSVQYKLWRESIFKRDKYSCQKCKVVGGHLQADHIKQFALILFENDVKTFQEALWCVELWDVTNGRTLCTDCHKKTPTYGKQLLLTINQYE